MCFAIRRDCQGANRDNDNGTDSGSAYLFDSTTGQQIANLLPDDGAAREYFGASVAISGAAAIVGATQDDDNGSLLDLTDEVTRRQAQYLAGVVGLDEVWVAQGNKVGSVVFVDAASKRILSQAPASNRIAALDRAIRESIKTAQNGR